MVMYYNTDAFREGIFTLNTRRFGTVAEIMIKKICDFEWSNCKQYDYDVDKDARIEVKFSRAEKTSHNNFREQCH